MARIGGAGGHGGNELMNELDAILASLELEPIGENRFRAENVPVEHGVVFGG